MAVGTRASYKRVSAEFDAAFDMYGARSAANLRRDEESQLPLLENSQWSLELKADRLLAYQIPASGVAAHEPRHESGK